MDLKFLLQENSGNGRTPHLGGSGEHRFSGLPDGEVSFELTSAVDTVLQGKELESPRFSSLRRLTDAGRTAAALPLPVNAGTRVAFIANIGSVLTYSDPPPDGIDGTVVTVRTGSGNATAQDGRVFVLWDDVKLRGIMAEHLRRAKVTSRQAQNVRMVVSNLGDLSSFFASGGRQDELVHKATKDLWAFKKDGDQYVIERLFDDTGKPLKV